MNFADILLTWFDENHRDLPWRGESDPYKIWVSEIILQQTRVVQGIAYYHNFLAHFPDIKALATAPEDDVLKVWQGLGYYSRARNMHAAAQSIMENHNGKFPHNYQEIRKLKGIGDYTAAAIGSIAFNLPYPAVDGNVLRFISRHFGIFDNIALNSTRKKIEGICTKNLPPKHAGRYNQALMEMGAIQCTPHNPQCENCPFAESCYALQHLQVTVLPIKELQIHIKDRFFHYLIYLCGNQTIIQQRTGNDIWKGLFEFPLVETENDNFNIDDYLSKNGIAAAEKPQLGFQKKHVLTHQNIHAKFWLIPLLKMPETDGNQQIVNLTQLKDFAVAKITQEAIGRLDGQL